MAKIKVKPDCGNAPRKLFLKELYSAFANGDADTVADIIPEGISWNKVGETLISGKEDYLSRLKKHKLWKVKELVIDTIITHGPEASVSGHVISGDKKKYAFSEIYGFKSAGGRTNNSVTSFIIKE